MAGLYHGPIVDAHHHLWDRSLDRHPWLRGETGVLGRDCLPADYLAAAGGRDVVATVHVEAGWEAGDPFAELAWLDQLQRPAGLAARYVARATLDAADAEATLERLAAQPRVVGVRDILSWHPEPRRSFCADRHRMSSPAWRAGFAALDRHGLSFDLMISPWQMAEARQLAQAFPATRFALNHCGSPFDQSEDGLAHWQQGLRRLAELPNVEIKISDVVAYQPGWSAQSVRRIVLTCLDIFGPDRAMLASDHPVVERAASFAQAYGSFEAALEQCSGAEQFALFAGNASRFYRLDDVLRREP